MINAIMVLIMCIFRIVYLSVPAMLIIITGLIILNKIFGISIIKMINKQMMKGVK